MTMVRRGLGAVVALVVVVGIAACAESGAVPVPEPTAAVETEVGEAAGESVEQATAAADEGECGHQTAEEAISAAITDVPTMVRGDPMWEWDLAAADLSTFDACADLSWVTVTIEGATASSPSQVVFFNRGRYVGPASPLPFGLLEGVERLSDDSVQVVWAYFKGTESTSDARGQAVSTFTWDEARGRLEREGQYPPVG